MSARPQPTYTLPQVLDLPTGNVHLVPVCFDDETSNVGGDESPESSADASCEWVICDASGSALDAVSGGRSHAVRQMSVIAVRGAALPLVLYGPDGVPTGDRLPG